MPLSDMDVLLPALRNAFGERAVFVVPDTGEQVTFEGRFRIDPHDLALGGPHDGLNVTQTWFYVDTRDVPSSRKPGQGDYLLIRGDWFEIAQLDADDIGELGYRLLRGAKRVAATDESKDPRSNH